MGLFEAQVEWVRDYVARGLERGRLVDLDPDEAHPWPTGRSFVLARDTAVELGSPAVGSVGFLVWSAASARRPRPARVLLEGPELAELAARGPDPVPFGQVVVVHGAPPDDYEGYLALKEALYGVSLEGVALRSVPSQAHLWCRVHAEAVAAGFDFGKLGFGIAGRLSRLDHVWGVDVLFHTAGRHGLTPLAEIADQVTHVVGALIKRHEEEHAECDTCEYNDVCDEREHRPRPEVP